MSPRASLKNVHIDLSGECPVCGDILLTAPKSMDKHTLEDVRQDLEHIFDQHLSRKHAPELISSRVRADAS